MTTPPPGQSPDDDQPPNGPPPPPPYAYGPPPYQQPYGAPPPYPYGAPPPRPAPRISAGMAVLGVFGYFLINVTVAMMAIATADSGKGVLIGAAVFLAAIAFVGGGVLLAMPSPTVKGLGLGLMIGWALTSVVTAGFCTGINPTMYS